MNLGEKAKLVQDTSEFAVMPLEHILESIAK